MAAKFLGEQCDLQIKFTGPARTGLSLDSRLLLGRAGDAVRAEVANALGATEWGYPAPVERESGMEIDADTRRGVTAHAPYFVHRRIVAGDGTITADKRSWDAALRIDGATLTIEEILIKFHEFGFCSISFCCRCRGTDGMTVAEFRDAVERGSSMLNSFQALFEGTIKALSDLLQTRHRSLLSPSQDTILDQSEIAFGAQLSTKDAHPGSLRWVHRIFCIGADSAGQIADCDDDLRRLVFTDSPDQLANCSIGPNARIYASTGNSVRMALARGDRPCWSDTLWEMIETQNVYWAAADVIDDELFHFVSRISLEKIRGSVHRLEDRSKDIIDFQEQIIFFRAIYDDFETHLDPESERVWGSIERSWKTLGRFAAIEKKLSILERIYDRVMSDLDQIYNKRLNAVVVAFTLISMISVVIDGIDFTQAGGLHQAQPIRLALLAILAAVLVVFGAGILHRGRRR